MEKAGSPRSRTRQHDRERRAHRRRRALRFVGALVAVAVVFFCGLAVGLALRDNKDAQGQTLVRTLVPTTITPAKTVTVTVSNP